MKVGLIGCGRFGSNILKTLLEFKNIKEIHIEDLDSKAVHRLKESVNDVRVMGGIGFGQILRNQEIRTVFIATPAETHYKLAVDHLSAGKHVFLEKPFTLNLESAQNLHALAESLKGRQRLHIDNTFIYSKEINELKEKVVLDKLGKIHSYYSRRANWGPCWPETIDVNFDLVCHDLSIIDYVFGINEFDGIRVLANKNICKSKIDDLIVDLKSGDFSARIHASWVWPNKTREIIVRGESDWYRSDSGIEKTPLFGINEKPDNPLKTEINHFFECIGQNKPSLSNHNHGLSIVKNLCKIEKEYKNLA